MLTGVCDDPWDADLVATWLVQGAAGGTHTHTGDIYTLTLVEDSYTATFVCTDGAGASDSVSIGLSVLPVLPVPDNLPPTATIVSPANSDVYAYHSTTLAESIDFDATVSDSDGTVVGLTWAAQEVGSTGSPVVFDSRQTFTLELTDCSTPLGCPSSLPVSFDITLTAEDNEGATTTTTVRITIEYWVT